MKVLAARRDRQGGHRRPAVAALLLGLLAATGFAQDLRSPASDTAVVARGARAPRLEVTTSSLPSFDSGDAARTTRLDMIWLPPRHPSLGLALGMTNNDGMGLRPFGTTTTPSVDLGLHWRYDDTYRIDVTAWRRMSTPDTPALLTQDRQGNYGARLEMQMNAKTRSFRVEHGFLGMQLEGGGRIGVRRYAGHPMLYYRTSF